MPDPVAAEVLESSALGFAAAANGELQASKVCGGSRLLIPAGAARNWLCDFTALHARSGVDLAGSRYCAKTVVLPWTLPWGYHRLRLEVGGDVGQPRVLGRVVVEEPDRLGHAREVVVGGGDGRHLLHEGSSGLVARNLHIDK